MSLNRREFLALAGVGTGVAAAGVSLPGLAQGAPWVLGSAKALLPPSKGTRLVVIGASFGGIATAQTVKKLAPEAEVVLLERASFFLSCPATIEYVFGLIPLEKITFGYGAVERKGIKVLRTEVLGIDPAQRQVATTGGSVAYDALLIASGIRLAYEEVPGLVEAGAWNASVYDKGSPIVDLYHQIQAFRGGTVVLNAPPGTYKCPPGPYEYALLWADHITKKKLKAKVVMIDPKAKPIPPPIAEGFLKAMEKFKAVLDYQSNTKILGVDGAKKTVKTDLGEVKTDFLSLIPPNKTAGFLKEAGLGDPFVLVDPRSFRTNKDERIFALGDVVDTPYAKSAYTAVTSAKVAGAHIARALGAKVADPAPPHNICYPLVNAEETLMVRADWSWEVKDGKVEVKTKGTSDNTPKK
ncbi:MAG: FAD-dependent oxidoreductase, partial [Nitrospirae bacterium]|nr:FAD-dependent oxidoreductase [Nitrospirota bacterium]